MPNRIVRNPEVLGGKPIIEGTRISVAFVLELLGGGMGIDEILEEYPQLTREAVDAAIEYSQQTSDRK